jgi:hypothetical protein
VNRNQEENDFSCRCAAGLSPILGATCSPGDNPYAFLMNGA